MVKFSDRAMPYPSYRRHHRRAADANANSMSMIVRNPSCFPSTLETDLFFTQSVSISITGGVGSAQLWRGNSLYDPDYTGTGNQPRWFDQLMAVYSTYEVLYSQAEVIVTKETGTTLNTIRVAFAPYGVLDSVTPVFEDISEASNGQLAVLHNTTTCAHLYAAGNTQALTGYRPGESLLTGTSGTSPGINWKFALIAQGLVSDTVTLQALIRIKYRCIFSDINQSAS